MGRWTFAFAVFLVMATLTLAWVALYRRGWARGSPGRRRALRLLGATCAGLYSTVLLEVGFGLFVVKSDGYGITRAGHEWFQTHWRPINELGYRDVDPKVDGRRVLVVLGDSLAAGHGIPASEDRFANVLQRGLGEEWQVPVVAICGWNLAEEAAGLAAWPHRVDAVLVAYTLTDIESAANERGFSRPDPVITPPHPVLRAAIAHSYVINYVYWRCLRRGFGDRYETFLNDVYHHPGVWQAHEARLRALIELARARGATIQFVLWPDLPRIEASSVFTSKVARFLEQQGVRALDLSPRFRGRAVEEMVVNSMDGHPNEAIHAEVGELLIEWLER